MYIGAFDLMIEIAKYAFIFVHSLMAIGQYIYLLKKTMNGKNIALLSYIPILGWIIAFILYLENNTKDSIARFHLRQTLGLLITYIGGSMILAFFKIGLLFFPFQLACAVLWILGLLSALKDEEKPVALLGVYYQEWFKNFIR
jgi:hypothetical protein